MGGATMSLIVPLVAQLATSAVARTGPVLHQVHTVLGPLAQGAENPFTGLTTTLTTWLQQLIVPGAIIGLLAAILFFLIGPMFPDLSASSKGYMQKALLAIVFAGVVPGVVTALSSMGGGAGGGGG